jgi:hypothetical protein
MEMCKRLEWGENGFPYEFLLCNQQIHIMSISHTPFILDNGEFTAIDSPNPFIVGIES